jgi:putative DNA primase/helicase
LKACRRSIRNLPGSASTSILGLRLGQLSNGKEAWLKHIGADGRIHGAIVHIGTPHSRAAHFNPNLAQVPNPKKGKPLATECRALFHHSGDWVFANCDQSGLQDRCFSHYLAAFDGGAYGRSFVAGVDTHWNSVTALGFISGERDKASKLHSTLRESGGKPFRYGFLFGMRGKRAGEIIATAVRAARQVDPSYVGPSINGNQALRRFEAATPGLKQLRLNLEAQAERNGWVSGLDGRRVPTGAQYKALNRIVTSAEAIICKRWLINVYDELCARFRYGWDGDVVITAWVHDELVICCRPEIAREAGEIMVRHAREAGEFYDLKVPLDAEYKIGSSWAGDAGAENTKEFCGPTSCSQPSSAPIPDQNDEKANMNNAAEGDSEDSDTATDERNPLDELLAAAYHAQSTSESEDEENIDDEDDPTDSGGDSSSDTGANSGSTAETFSGDPELGPYIYRDVSGKPHAKIVRTPGRQSRFTQQHWTGTAWATGMPKHKLPYRLPELLAADPASWVCLAEGEKDVVNVAKLGFVATTNPNGAKGWNSAKLVPYFAHLRRIAILEDNDAAGRERSKRIIKTLCLLDPMPDIRVVPFLELPEGGDVSDWLKQGHGYAELLTRIEAIPAGGEGILESVCADQVTLRAIHWLWGKRFAVGKIGIIAGLPDEGKGQILCYIAARATRGLEWPNNEGVSPKGNVIILSAEENPGDSLAPRLKAAGADLSRIYFINMVQDRDERGQDRRRMFSFVTDLEKLRRKIVEVGNVVTVEIDPISAYLGIGAVDSYRDTDVRAVLGPLKDLAEEMKIAVITVMHFNKKVDITNALLRVSNSMAFVGLPRHAYGVINDADNARKLFVRAKNNDASESDNQTLAFHFEVKDVGIDPESGEHIIAPLIVWEPGYVDVTANEAMQAASENKSPGARDKAKNILVALLTESGEVFADEIEETAKGHGISMKTMRRAAEELDVVIDKDRSTPKGKWFWKLPQ